MSSMAVTGRQFLAATVGAAFLISACSNGDDSGLPTLEEAAATSTTSTTEATTTTTTEPTTTTLSELQLAEAEVERVAVEWYTFPIDTSVEGNAEQELEFLTGILRQRAIDTDASYQADGLIRRVVEPPPIRINDVTVDLDAGTAEIGACTGATDLFLDAESLELVFADDPGFTTTSVFQLQLVDGNWKINEWLPSDFAPSGPVTCEIAQ